MSDAMPCAECGMQVDAGEYHPYAACLMFRACASAQTVRTNLKAVLDKSSAMPIVLPTTKEPAKPSKDDMLVIAGERRMKRWCKEAIEAQGFRVAE